LQFLRPNANLSSFQKTVHYVAVKTKGMSYKLRSLKNEMTQFKIELIQFINKIANFNLGQATKTHREWR